MDEQYDPNLYNPQNQNDFEDYNEGGEKINSLGSEHEDPNNLEENEQYQNQNIEDLAQYQDPEWRRTKF